MGKIKHYIQTEDLQPDEYMEIVKRAEAYEKDPASAYHLCEGQIIATMFLKESTRTAALFQAAMQKMGGGWFGMQGTAGTYLASGEEDLEDTLRSVAPFANIMAVRHNSLNLYDLADTFPIPLVNGMTGSDEHTVSGAWSLYSLYKLFGRVDNLKIGLYGQTKNCRPLKTYQKLLSLFGVEIFEDPVVDALATPEHIVKFATSHKGTYTRAKLEDFIDKVDVLFVTDGMPSSSEDPAVMKEFNQKFHTMTLEDFKHLRSDAYLYYEEPRAMTDGRLTVAKEVDHDPRVINKQMMADALWANMAVITYLLDQVKA